MGFFSLVAFSVTAPGRWSTKACSLTRTSWEVLVESLINVFPTSVAYSLPSVGLVCGCYGQGPKERWSHPSSSAAAIWSLVTQPYVQSWATCGATDLQEKGFIINIYLLGNHRIEYATMVKSNSYIYTILKIICIKKRPVGLCYQASSTVG